MHDTRIPCKNLQLTPSIINTIQTREASLQKPPSLSPLLDSRKSIPLNATRALVLVCEVLFRVRRCFFFAYVEPLGRGGGRKDVFLLNGREGRREGGKEEGGLGNDFECGKDRGRTAKWID